VSVGLQVVHTLGKVNRHLDDGIGVLCSDLLNVHPTLVAAHQYGALEQQQLAPAHTIVWVGGCARKYLCCAVHENGKVVLAARIEALAHVDLRQRRRHETVVRQHINGRCRHTELHGRPCTPVCLVMRLDPSIFELICSASPALERSSQPRAAK
jgi:hypothetical protein